MDLKKLINDKVSNIKELSIDEIKFKENNKLKKDRGKEKYKLKGTEVYVTFIGPSKPKKREVN